MRILFLNLASHSTLPGEGSCIACVTEEETAAIRFADHRIGDDGLMPLVDEVLTEAAMTDRDITHIACVTGPGGFTSLRMAVTLANVYGDQLRAPLAGVHLSDLYAARAAARDWVWIHATKKKELFVRGFGSHAEHWPEPTLTALEELAETYPTSAPFAGELLPEQRALLSARNPQDLPLSPLPDTLPGFLRHLTYTDAPLAPWYGRGW